MYDTFSSDYDRFVNWPERSRVEMPFILAQLNAAEGMRRVLDAACGTGMHAVALAQQGFTAVGVDLSAGMVERARLNALNAGVKVNFLVAGFGELALALEREDMLESPFDAVLCLGNSLPHVLTLEDLRATLGDFAACLRPGGLVLIQNRNFDSVLAHHLRWMEPQSYREGEREWLFLRLYDFEPQGLLAFNMIILRREAGGAWQQQIVATHLQPLLRAELDRNLSDAGFIDLTSFGNLSGAPFDPETSGNLVLIGKLAG